MKDRKFELGAVVATPGALAERVAEILTLHSSCNWGIVGTEDALKNGTRIFSAFHIVEGDLGSGKVWVITEADHSSTCILLPDEY